MNPAPTNFLAIEVSASVRHALTPQMVALADMGEGVRPVHAEGLHVTLRYLGRIDQQDAVRAVAAQVALAGHPFTIVLKGAQLQPPGPSPRVVWLPAGEGEEELIGVVATLNVALAGQGWAPPGQLFKAHCTLARLSTKLAPGTRSQLDRLCAWSAGEGSLQMAVKSLFLMESVPAPGQPNSYRRRGHWPLGGE